MLKRVSSGRTDACKGVRQLCLDGCGVTRDEGNPMQRVQRPERTANRREVIHQRMLVLAIAMSECGHDW